MHRLQAARRDFVANGRDRHAQLAAICDIETRFIRLSERERQVLQHVVSGHSNKQIAGDLGIAEVTVKFHRGAMMRKMGAASLVELVRLWDAMVRFAD